MDSAVKDRVAFSWFTLAWDDYWENLPLLAAVALAQAALAAGTVHIIGRTHSLLHAVPYMLLIVTPVAIGANLVYIKAARSAGPRFSDLFSAFPVWHRALPVSMLLGLATVAGLALLIIPGIVIHLTYMFGEYAVVDRRTGVRESFALSADIAEGWRTRLFPVLLLTVALSFVVPDIYMVSGTLKAPEAALDLRPWTVTAAAIKTLVFLPWLNMTMARAYNFLSALPGTRVARAE